jgi:hypothetical protein
MTQVSRGCSTDYRAWTVSSVYHVGTCQEWQLSHLNRLRALPMHVLWWCPCQLIEVKIWCGRWFIEEREGHWVSCTTPGLHKNQASKKGDWARREREMRWLGVNIFWRKLTIETMVSRGCVYVYENYLVVSSIGTVLIILIKDGRQTHCGMSNAANPSVTMTLGLLSRASHGSRGPLVQAPAFGVHSLDHSR